MNQIHLNHEKHFIAYLILIEAQQVKTQLSKEKMSAWLDETKMFFVK